MSIIAFNPHAQQNNTPFDFSADTLPDVDTMELPALTAYREFIEDQIHQLDLEEPKNEASEAYDEWADEHEELEDILDDILDRMEELS